MERYALNADKMTDLRQPGNTRDDGLCLFPGEEDGLDPFALPFESEDEYSSAPLEFEEIARTLWEDLNDVYALAVRTNRHSPDYQVLCARLEKNIRLVGSLCVTGAVLEQKEQPLSLPEGMDVKELYAMVSLHFRKCDRAYRELRDSGKGLDMSLLDQVTRWAALAEKLKATGEKIRNIRSGRISADSLLERAEVFRGAVRDRRPSGAVKAIRRASSLPVLRSYARGLARQKRLEEAETRREAAREERRRQMLEKQMDRIGPDWAKPFEPSPADIAWAKSDIYREKMLKEAEARNDRAAADRIRAAEFPEILKMWQEHEAARKEAPPRVILTQGPPEDLRRKLRAQRKKKKRN